MKDLIDLTKIVSIGSFIIGTFIFMLFIINPDYFPLVTFGYIFVLIAFIINSIFFVLILVSIFINKIHRKSLLKTLGLLIGNIPIATIYFFIVLKVLFPEKG